MSIEEFFLLFQRGVVALERLADVPQVTISAASLAEQAPAVETPKPRKPRGTKAPAVTFVDGQITITPDSAAKVVAVVHDEVLVEETAPEEVIDAEFEDVVEEIPVPTIDDMRSALRAYQMATSPTEAMKLLSTFSGATTLTKVPEGERAAMVKAALDGAAARKA